MNVATPDIESERRRPGITALAIVIAKQHPRWPHSKVLAEAKKQYHAKQHHPQRKPHERTRC